ncbi:MAG: hypothetical protein QXH27_01335 [Candidatus Micrarchaeia archaeon]
MALRLARRAIVAGRRRGFGLPLAEGRLLSTEELNTLRAIWRYDGSIDLVSLASELRIICSADEYTHRIKRKLTPILVGLRGARLIDFRSNGEGEMEIVLTKEGMGALTAADPELSKNLDELTKIHSRIEDMPLKKLEKKLLFASFVSEMGEPNTEHRLKVAAIAAERREIFQTYPVLYLGALHDIEHALHFPASRFVLVDRRYDHYDLDYMADKLAYYAGCGVDVLQGNPGTIKLSHNSETKTFELVSAEGLAFMREMKEAISTLIAKGVTALLHKVKHDEELQQELVRLIMPGGLLWEAEHADCLVRPAGMQVVAEGELAVWRFPSEDFENAPAILLQKPF